MNLPPYRQVLECASPLALSDLARRRKSVRGLPQSKTLARPRRPRCSSWSRGMRKSDRRLPRNRLRRNADFPVGASRRLEDRRHEAASVHGTTL